MAIRTVQRARDWYCLYRLLFSRDTFFRLRRYYAPCHLDSKTPVTNTHEKQPSASEKKSESPVYDIIDVMPPDANLEGREWKVYYANDIPLPYSPWKLNGAKALILRAEDTNGKFRV